MVFLRLAEDVLLFQNIPYQRRREIMNALTENMPGLFEYFMNTLQNNYAIHEQLVSIMQTPCEKGSGNWCT